MGQFNSIEKNGDYTINKDSLNEVEKLVAKCISLYETQKIQQLQQALYELYINFNKSHSGNIIINYPRKDQLAECFTMMLKYDWIHDNDIREVWAENGFYCLIKYMTIDVKTQEDQIAAGLNLFLHLHVGGDNLLHKIEHILCNAKSVNNPTFSDFDYELGAEGIISQFLFLSANIIRPVVSNHNILTPPLLETYNQILDIKSFYKFQPQELFKKAKFISAIIESILIDM